MVSIIVPVYNGENTLRRCLDSILSQSYQDYEVLIIDDGSTDESVAVCSDYIRKDKRFKLISKPNQGVSSARNTGISESQGEFITFVDCDDWIEPTMLALMCDKLADETVDMVYMNMFYEYNDGRAIGTLSKSPIHKCDISSYYLAILLPESSLYYNNVRQDHDILGAAWGKMIRKRLIDKHNLRFNESLVLSEDSLFYLYAFLKARDVIIDRTPVYHYRISSTSSNFRYRPDIEKQSENFFRCYNDFSENIDSSQKVLFKDLVRYRCYYELITRYVGHSGNPQNIIGKYKQLRTHIQNPIYIYTGDIPNFVNLFKKAEIAALKNKRVLLLLLLHEIRKMVKSHIKRKQ